MRQPPGTALQSAEPMGGGDSRGTVCLFCAPALGKSTCLQNLLDQACPSCPQRTFPGLESDLLPLNPGEPACAKGVSLSMWVSRSSLDKLRPRADRQGRAAAHSGETWDFITQHLQSIIHPSSCSSPEAVGIGKRLGQDKKASEMLFLLCHHHCDSGISACVAALTAPKSSPSPSNQGFAGTAQVRTSGSSCTYRDLPACDLVGWAQGESFSRSGPKCSTHPLGTGHLPYHEWKAC